ncbi:MAG: PQQ-binding-like beta-propeller repeat protein, partial [Candidatus Thermoplasmatota archaeon]
TGGSVYSSPAIGSDGTIYVGSRDTNLYALNPDGTEKWRFDTGNYVLSSPAIGSDGTIYVGTYDAKLVAVTGEHTLKLNDPIGQGTVEVDGQEITEWSYEEVYLHNTEVELEAIPDEDWRFREWSGTNKTGEQITITMDSDKVITAVFEEIEWYNLTVNIEGEGEVTIDPDQTEFEDGTEVNLTAEPAENWEFVTWSGDYGSTEEEITITMDSDMEITATFRKLPYELTVNIEGEGEVEIDPDQTEYEEGTEVNLTALPADGWKFKAWTGDYGSTEEEITITMDSDMEITANFEEKEDGGIPGFTSIILLIAVVTAVAIYHKKYN